MKTAREKVEEQDVSDQSYPEERLKEVWDKGRNQIVHMGILV